MCLQIEGTFIIRDSSQLLSVAQTLTHLRLVAYLSKCKLFIDSAPGGMTQHVDEAWLWRHLPKLQNLQVSSLNQGDRRAFASWLPVMTHSHVS